MKKTLIRFLLILSLLIATMPMYSINANCRPLFEGDFQVDGQRRMITTNKAEDLINFFRNDSLQRFFSNYNENSEVISLVRFRDIIATVTIPQNSTILRFVVPGAFIDQSFQGATRNETQKLFLNWLRGEGRELLTKFLQYSVASTAFDPVSGNPNSLMAQMGEADFAVGLPSQRIGPGASIRSRFSLGLEARFGRYVISGRDSDVYTIPIRAEFPIFGSEILIDAPVTLIDTNGAYSYFGSFGIGFPVKMSFVPSWMNWTLTPMARIGAVGSVDLGAVGAVWSLSITSGVDIRILDGTSITIGNMVTNLRTIPISFQNYNISYDIQNYIFRNGIIVNQRIGEYFGRYTELTGFIIDTRFSGDAVFVRSYQQFGSYISFGEIRFGFTYTRGEKGYSGFSLNSGITF